MRSRTKRTEGHPAKREQLPIEKNNEDADKDDGEDCLT